MYREIMLPENSPEWLQKVTKDRELFWSYVESCEQRPDSRTAREVVVALQHELTDEQNVALLKDFVPEVIASRGVVTDLAIHPANPLGEEKNRHAHLLITTRKIDQNGFGFKLEELDSQELLEEWREQWANYVNRHLERNGHDQRVDHRSHKSRGLGIEPLIHIGPAANYCNRKGINTIRGNKLLAIREINRRHFELSKSDFVSPRMEEHRRDVAISNIQSVVQKDRQLSAEDIRNLNRNDLENIKTTGIEYLKEIIKGLELELEQERER